MYIDNRLKYINRVTPITGRYNFLRLDQNENLCGLPKRVFKKAKKRIIPDLIGGYPDESGFIDAYTKLMNLNKCQISLTCGSVSAMGYVFKVFGQPKKNLICVTPTFGMYKLYAEMSGMNVIQIGYTDNYTVDSRSILTAINNDTSIVSIINPNMPIGDVYSKYDVIKILDKAKAVGAIVILDEAYYHFYNKSFIDLLTSYDNLIIVRTFSKFFAMAGLRLGVIISNPNIINYIDLYKPHYTVNSVALVFAEEIIRNHKTVCEKLSREFNVAKQFLIKELTKNNYQFIPTNSCHICIFPKNKNCKEVFEGLKNAGILVFKGKAETEGMIRVTITKLKYMKKFMSTLLKVDVL